MPQVLRPYFEQFNIAMGGALGKDSYERLLCEFKLSAIDFLRWLSGARLKGFTPEKMAAMAESEDINRALCLKSPRRMCWIWRCVWEFLEEVNRGTLVI